MRKTFVSALVGIVTGFANGLFGAGGGTILVPSLEKFLKVDVHKAHATAIPIILPLSIISTFVYLKGGEVDWKLTVYVSIGGIIGGWIGAKALTKVSGGMLHKIFGVFMVAAAVRMIL